MEDADRLRFDFEGSIDSGPVQPTDSSFPVALPETSSSAAINVAPSYDDSAATAVGPGRGRSFWRTVYRHWLRCLCVKYRDDEKDRLCSSSSKVASIPLPSKERDCNNKKDTSLSKLDSIPLQSKERDRNNDKDTSLCKVASIPLQSKERDCNNKKDTSLSKLDSIPLQSKERDRNNDKDTSLCKVASIPLQSKERDCNNKKDTSLSKLDSIPLQSKERDRNNDKNTSLCKVASIPLQSNERDRKTEKATSSSKIDPLPLDLEIDILSRLPAKSLMKFQCVSKMWSSIIRSQSFVDSFFSMSSMTQSRFLISFSNGGPSAIDKRLFIFSSSHKGRESSSLETNLHMTIPSVTLTSRSGSTCVSVHGFLGIGAGNPFIVCNLITGKLTCLPGPRTSLGYDPVDDQFKALTMLSNPYQQPDFLVHEVITLLVGGESCWRRNRVITPFYYTVTKAISINGFVYFGAWSPKRGENPVIVCFDVRHERISFIQAPMVVLYWEGKSILINYKGKLASIARDPYADFDSFDLWILEDADKHDWSKQTFDLPFSLGFGEEMISPGINKAGEIIFAPVSLLQEPFYIFYFNVDTNDIRKVMLKGLGDDEHFRRRYGIGEQCCVHISPEHVESIASL